jgi:hypothetical protein
MRAMMPLSAASTICPGSFWTIAKTGGAERDVRIVVQLRCADH